MASTSVPSITAPLRMDNPIPAPRKQPPYIASNKLSFVMFGKGTVASTKCQPGDGEHCFHCKYFTHYFITKQYKGNIDTNN